MKIFTTVNPNVINNIYFVTDDEQQYGIIIDPGAFSLNVYNLIKRTGAEIKKIIVTHNVDDQVAGIPLIKKIYDVPIFSHNDKVMGFDAVKVKHGTIIKEGCLQFRVIDTPTHTYDSISLLIGDALFVGGVLQAGAVGIIDDSFISYDMVKKIIKDNILSLPNSTIIYPAKGPATTIELEIKFNPFFKEIYEEE